MVFDYLIVSTWQEEERYRLAFPICDQLYYDGHQP